MTGKARINEINHMMTCHPHFVPKKQILLCWVANMGTGSWVPAALETLFKDSVLTVHIMVNREDCRNHNEKVIWKVKVTAQMGAQGTSTTLPKLQFNVQAKYIARRIREAMWSGGYRRGLGTTRILLGFYLEWSAPCVTWRKLLWFLYLLVSSDMDVDRKQNVTKIFWHCSQTLSMQNKSAFLTIHYGRGCHRRGSKKTAWFLNKKQNQAKISSISVVKEMCMNSTENTTLRTLPGEGGFLEKRKRCQEDLAGIVTPIC